MGHPVTGGYKYMDLVLQVGGLDARLMTLLCKRIIFSKSKQVKTTSILTDLLRKAMAQKGLFCR
jgi:hypothetical protein